jgi:hypothetical protein
MQLQGKCVVATNRRVVAPQVRRQALYVANADTGFAYLPDWVLFYIENKFGDGLLGFEDRYCR